jgi:branched-chain amino acid transport system ATP-binding protein
MSIIVVEGLSIAFAGVRAVDGLSFAIPKGVIYSVIGPNGAGKTTLFNMISGLYRPRRGRIVLEGQDVTHLAPHVLAARGLSRTFQNLQVFSRLSVLENVMIGRHLHEHRAVLPHLLRLPSVLRTNRGSEETSRSLLQGVGLAGAADRAAGSLPYGALKRLEIARALASEPKLLILDEPAAGCNAAEKADIAAIIEQVARRGITVALIEHDMKLVMGISARILVLDNGRKLAEGPPAEVRRKPDVIRAYLGTRGAAEDAHARG